MSTEFDDSEHYALFKGQGAIRTGNSFEVRWSEITLAALRSAGFLDNMVDGLTPPSIDLLWLDKNTDPATLKEWNPVGFNWQKVTAQTLFGRVPFRGAWQASLIYRPGDLVSYGGNIWIATLPSQNHAPQDDAFWDVFIDGSGYIASSEKGVGGGVATLGPDAKINDAQLKFRDTVGDSISPVRSWRGYPELSTLTAVGALASNSGGYLKLTSSTGDPLLRVVSTAIGGFVERYLGIRYRRISGGPGLSSSDGVFWGTAGHGSDDGAYRYEFEPAPLGVWQTVILDMWSATSGGDDWRNSTVNALRFDLFSGIGSEVEVSWIASFADSPRRGDAQNEAFFVRFWPDTSRSPFGTQRVRIGVNNGVIEDVIAGSENNGWLNSVSPIGRAGAMFGSRSSDNPTVGDSGTYASGHFVIHNSDKESWVQYSEGRVDAVAGGMCGHEINVISKKTLIPNDPYNIYAPHSVTAQILSSGRPDVVGGLPLASYLNIQHNGAEADKGINIGYNAVTVKSGHADAINLAKNHAIQQWTATGFKGAGIRFDVVDSTQSLLQIFGDSFVKWRLRDAGLDALLLTTTLLTSYVPVKFPSFTKAAKPSASAMGAGATIYISNDTSNRRLATSDGTDWRFQDGTVVPAS